MCLKTGLKKKKSTFRAWIVLGETSVYEDFTAFSALSKMDWYISINSVLGQHSKQQLPCLLSSVLHWRWLKRSIIHSRAKWASAISSIRGEHTHSHSHTHTECHSSLIYWYFSQIRLLKRTVLSRNIMQIVAFLWFLYYIETDFLKNDF